MRPHEKRQAFVTMAHLRGGSVPALFRVVITPTLRTHGRLRMTRVMFGLLLCAIGSPAGWAAKENVEVYGNHRFDGCTVETIHDDFTDSVTGHSLTCSQNGNMFGLTCSADGGMIVLFARDRNWFAVGDEINVRFRWGTRKANEGNWIPFGKESALSTDDSIHDSFLSGMADEDKLIYEIGLAPRAAMELNDTARRAVPDYQARCTEGGAVQ